MGEQGDLNAKIDDLDKQNKNLDQKIGVSDEEKAQLETRLRQIDIKNEQLNENLETLQHQMGVPQTQFNQAKQEEKKNEEDIFKIK